MAAFPEAPKAIKRPKAKTEAKTERMMVVSNRVLPAMYLGSAVDHPKLRVLHDRSIRRDNFVMPDHPVSVTVHLTQ